MRSMARAALAHPAPRRALPQAAPATTAGPARAMPAAAVLIGAVALAVTGAQPSAAYGAGPQNHARSRAIESHGRALVEAINTTDEPARSAILGRIFAGEMVAGADGVAKLSGAMESMRGMIGPAQFHHAEITGTAVHLFMKGREGMWRDLQMRFEQEEPWRFTKIVFLAEVTEPVYLPNGAIESPHTLEWLNGYIDRLVAENDLSGSILLVRDDTVILRRAFGWEDAARTREVTDATRFGLASGSKMFTALVIAQLAREGRLSLDDPIIKYVPELPDREHAMKATLRHLLSHTSGFGDYWTEEYERAWHRTKTLRDVLPFALMERPHFAPGGGVRYSNTAFLLLGLVIEKVTGEDYFDVVGRRIFVPAGMASSGWFRRDAPVERQAEPLVRAEGGGWARAELGLMGTSAGGSSSTVDDVWGFFKALRSGAFLGREATTALLLPRAGESEGGMQFGYGFFLWNEGGSTSFGHGGQARGSNFEGRYFPRERVTLVIFSNQDNGAYDDLRKNTVKLVTGAR